MTTNSLKAYERVIPELPRRRAEVYRAIIRRESTIRELCEVLGRPWQSVGPRVVELRDQGMIEARGDLGGLTVWGAISPPPSPSQLAPKKKPKKFRAVVVGVEMSFSLGRLVKICPNDWHDVPDLRPGDTVTVTVA